MVTCHLDPKRFSKTKQFKSAIAPAYGRLPNLYWHTVQQFERLGDKFRGVFAVEIAASFPQNISDAGQYAGDKRLAVGGKSLRIE